MTHSEPVSLIKQKRHFMLIFQKHEDSIAARAEFRILKKPRPVFVSQSYQIKSCGRDLHFSTSQQLLRALFQMLALQTWTTTGSITGLAPVCFCINRFSSSRTCSFKSVTSSRSSRGAVLTASATTR